MRVHHTVGLAASLFAILVACSTGDAIIGEVPPEMEAPAPSFTGEDASIAPDAASAFASYCPSAECPAGYGTCKGSKFTCDVNLSTDIQNCGACGVQCPATTYYDGHFLSIYSCLEGQCVLACGAYAGFADCNGIVDDGCETSTKTNDNCGACGVKCTDPSKPCVQMPGSMQYACGCPSGMDVCESEDVNGFSVRKCVDLNSNDYNCGTCGNACNPESDAGPGLPNTYLGCVGGKCERPKCINGILNYWADCDDDIWVKGKGYTVNPNSNGCEINAYLDEHCGACDAKAPAGQRCYLEPRGFLITPAIGCAPGQTFCGSEAFGDLPPIGLCVDLTSDVGNCGACNRTCPGGVNAVCNFGACEFSCGDGTANCNGDLTDGCEINTKSDPKNCGGCGVTCDVWAGQACVQGQCVVVPCDLDGGTVK